MPKANLRAVETERLHPRDRARQAVKRFRLDRERERLPISNQIDSGAPSLRVDDVLRRAEAELLGKR